MCYFVIFIVCLCVFADADEAAVPPAGGDMGAAAHGGHVHQETQSHH